MLSYLGEKSLVDVNTFQLLFYELLTLFVTWLNQISISSDLSAQFNPSLDTRPRGQCAENGEKGN